LAKVVLAQDHRVGSYFAAGWGDRRCWREREVSGLAWVCSRSWECSRGRGRGAAGGQLDRLTRSVVDL